MSIGDTSATETGFTACSCEPTSRAATHPGVACIPLELTGWHPGPRPVRRRG